ncbi:MAG: cobyric acid synthase [Alphaproteobacteria bacterium]|nr:cobyric acid synthase [Alphaproteobacteria bacterium]
MSAALMLQGTGSDVGKSLLVAGLARALTRRGLTVRPFKPQNMSNNAAVTPDGGEIGRAQALQARACGVAPSVHMNPVLLKPQGEIGAQIVLQGKVHGNAAARDYHKLKPELIASVLDSYRRLSAEADLVLVEGAGSPAEVNLRAGDIANMGFAEAADVPVVLVADIDRGGVLASLVGTHALLEPSEQARLHGYIVNKFRGDQSLFDPAIEIIGKRTSLDCHGVVPWFEGARHLPAEDAMALETLPEDTQPGAIRIAVPRLGRIANFDDLDPLAAEPDVAVILVQPGEPIPLDADVILLPGSKATRADLTALCAEGWDIDVKAHVRRGGIVMGLCAGYQMLGQQVSDPDAIEGPAGETSGLGLLDVNTVLAGDKTLSDASGTDIATGAAVHGYEMHIGCTEGPDTARPMLDLSGQKDGATTPDGRVMGCYLHGLFASDAYRAAFLDRIRSGRTAGAAYEARVEATLDDLADHLEQHVAINRLLAIAGITSESSR